MNRDDGNKHFNRGPGRLPSSHTLFPGFFVFSEYRHSERQHPSAHQDASVAVTAGRCIEGGAVPEKRHVGVPTHHHGGNVSAELDDPESRTNGQPSQNIRRLLVNAVRKVGRSTSGALKTVRGVDTRKGEHTQGSDPESRKKVRDERGTQPMEQYPSKRGTSSATEGETLLRVGFLIRQAKASEATVR